MEIKNTNYQKYKCFLDSDEKFLKSQCLSIQQIQDIKAFKLKGYKDQLLKKKIRNNILKNQNIKKVDDEWLHKKKLINEKSLKQSSEKMSAYKYDSTSVDYKNRQEMNLNNSRNNTNKLSYQISNSLKYNAQDNKNDELRMTTEETSDKTIEEKRHMRKKVLNIDKRISNNNLISLNKITIVESQREKNLRLKKNSLQIEKIIDDHEILQRLDPNTQHFKKMRILKEYDKAVLNLSNFTTLFTKNNTNKKEIIKPVPIISIISTPISNSKIIDPPIIDKNKLILPRISFISNKDSLFITEKNISQNGEDNLREGSNKMECSNSFESDVNKSEEDSLIMRMWQNKKKLGNQKKKSKMSKIFMKIYKTDVSKENEIKSIKKNCKNIHLEDYQKLLINSISDQLNSESICDLSHKFLRIREISNSIPKMEKMSYEELRRILRNEINQYDENSKIKYKECNSSGEKPNRIFHYKSVKKLERNLINIEKFVPKFLFEKLKKI